jgi:hypothetical protein
MSKEKETVKEKDIGNKDKHDKILQLLEDSKYLKSISEIDKLKTIILDELKLPSEIKRDYKKQLKEYLFVNEIDDLKTGTFLRCINMEDDDYKLKNPCIFCDVKITDKGMLLLCKTMTRSFLHIHMDKAIIFRKLKSEEKLLLLALNKNL